MRKVIAESKELINIQKVMDLSKYFRLMILVNAVLIVVYGVCNWDIWRTVYDIINAGYIEPGYSKFFWSPVLVRIDYGYNTWITFPNLSIIMLLIVAIANLMVIWKIEKHNQKN